MPPLAGALALVVALGGPAARAESAPSTADMTSATASAASSASTAASTASPVPANGNDIAPAARPTAADPALEARMFAITSELRCLVCQNQTIAESHADLAVDLRQQVRELLAQGQDEAQVRRYMTDRYGDFILYRPPLEQRTLALWLGPALLLAFAIATLLVVLARRARLADDRFEPDPPWDDEADQADPARRAPDSPARPGAPA